VKSISANQRSDLIGGFFLPSAAASRAVGLARLNADGLGGRRFQSRLRARRRVPDGLCKPTENILAGGYFRLSGAIVEFARLNADGHSG